MKRWSFILLLLPTLALAEGPKFSHSDADASQEFENVYNDIRKLFNKTIPSINVSTITFSSATGVSFTATNSTFSFVRTSTANVTALLVSTINGSPYRSVIASTQCFNSASKTVTNQTSFTDGNLKCTITPTSSSSRVRITTVFMCGIGTNGEREFIGLKRDSTDLFTVNSNHPAVAQAPAANWFGVCPFVYIDSPSTTSAVTYTTRVATGGTGTVYEIPVSGSEVMILDEVP